MVASPASWDQTVLNLYKWPSEETTRDTTQLRVFGCINSAFTAAKPEKSKWRFELVEDSEADDDQGATQIRNKS